jgi:cadmium resistance protein CadD (predicted permease)
MIGTIVAAVGLFAATNIDDLVVLTVLFVASARGALPGWKVVAGQYAGFVTLVAISVVAAAGLTIVPDKWVGLLGLIPLAIGIYGLVRTLRRRGDDDDDDDDAISAVGLLGVAGITIANGADNISLYTPVFRTNPVQDTVVTIIVFLVLVAVLERVEHWLVPAVFIGLGLYILIESGVLIRLVEALS